MADLGAQAKANTLQIPAQPADKTPHMPLEISLTQIALNDKVRFKQERLAVLTPPDRKRLEGRMGVVQGFWGSSRKLTVNFPEDLGRSVLRILSVDSRHLEKMVEVLIETERAPETAEVASGDERLSQEDMDNMFG